MRSSHCELRMLRLPRRMNQPGGWPRPETGWALTALRFEFSVLCHIPPVRTRLGIPLWRVNPPGSRAPPRKRMGVTASWFESTALLARMEDAPPARQRALKARGGHRPRGSTPPSSAGHDPAGRRGRPDKAVALGSTPRWPTGEYPLSLIRSRKGSRYTRVRAPPPQPTSRR